jgi:hypothetical protein
MAVSFGMSNPLSTTAARQQSAEAIMGGLHFEMCGMGLEASSP